MSTDIKVKSIIDDESLQQKHPNGDASVHEKLLTSEPKNNGWGNSKPDESLISFNPKTTRCNKKCCIITSLVAVGLIVVIVGGGFLRLYFKLNGKASSVDSSVWLNKLTASKSDDLSNVSTSTIFSGTYELVSYDENYHHYLTTLGIPSIISSLIIHSSETFYVDVGNPKGTWNMRRVSDLQDRSWSWEDGKPFELSWSKYQLNSTNICQVSYSNITIICSWDQQSSEMQFSSDGMIERRSLYNKEDDKMEQTLVVSTRKYFSRKNKIGMSENSTEKSQLNGFNPFSETKDMADQDDDFITDFEDF